VSDRVRPSIHALASGGRALTPVDHIFLQNAEGKRPVFGGAHRLQDDPHWRNNVLFYEYFHGDNGAGIGAVIRQDGRDWWRS
jgi:hypothetical protein